MARVPVLVLGDAARGDDGAALAAVRLLPTRIRQSADVRLIGQLDPAELLAHDDDVEVLIVDAVHGPPPGSVQAWTLAELRSDDLSPRRGGPSSTHAVPIGYALRLVAAVSGRVPHGRLIGLAGSDFRLGADLSSEVRSALPAFASAIGDEIDRIAGRNLPS